MGIDLTGDLISQAAGAVASHNSALAQRQNLIDTGSSGVSGKSVRHSFAKGATHPPFEMITSVRPSVA